MCQKLIVSKHFWGGTVLKSGFTKKLQYEISRGTSFKRRLTSSGLITQGLVLRFLNFTKLLI